MTKRDLFRILLKLLGVYGIVMVVLDLIKNIVYTIQIPSSFDIPTLSLIIIINFVALAIVTCITLKPDSIINLFNLDEGYDNNKIDLKVNFTTIVSSIIILIAFYVFINNIGLLINNIAFYTYTKDNQFNTPNNNNQLYIYPIINLVISFLLVTNYRRIADYIVSKGNNQPSDTDKGIDSPE